MYRPASKSIAMKCAQPTATVVSYENPLVNDDKSCFAPEENASKISGSEKDWYAKYP